MTARSKPSLGVTTSGEFELELFDLDGNHELRRYYPTIEAAGEVLRLFEPPPEQMPGQAGLFEPDDD
jgi:hypothetical protein